MAKKLIANKGYTVEVESWENDGDYRATETIVYENKEKALALLKLCKKLFSDGDGGIGNGMGGSEEKIKAYAKKNRKVISTLFGEDIDIDNGDHIVDSIRDLKGDIMGYTEIYDSRVFESGTVYYSPEDVYLEVIKK
jgi:hypothetical protein